MGPRFGVPQMVESRAAFGYLGDILPAGRSWLTASFGCFIVNRVSRTFALVTLTALLNNHHEVISFPVAFTIIVIAQVIVAFIGHNMIHQFERVIFPYLTIVFGIATVIILTQAHFDAGFNSKAPVPFGGPSAAFILAVFISFGYAIGWNPFASCDSRYLPRNSKPGTAGPGGRPWLFRLLHGARDCWRCRRYILDRDKPDGAIHQPSPVCTTDPGA